MGGKTGWQHAEEAADRASSGIFVKLENDGDKVVVYFLGEPFTYEVIWDEKTGGYETFTKEHETAGKKPSFKYKFNVYVPAEGMVKIFECSVQVFKTILAVKKKYGLDKKTFEIQRKGKKGDTKTTYTILPDNDLTAEQRGMMDKLPLHDLEKNGDETKPGDGKAGEFDTFKGKGGVVDAKVAEGYMGRLKVLPRAQIDKFLARFGVEKIKQVKAADADLADAFILFLEGKGPNPDEKAAPPAEPAKPAEKDPFAD